MLSWETENNLTVERNKAQKQGSTGIQRCSFIIFSPFWTNLPNHHIVGCLHDNCPKTPFHAEGCLWGTNYLPLCPSLPHPHPTPLTHPLISVGILFWLNGPKHKLPPPRPKLSLVHENKLDKKIRLQAWSLLRARHRKPRWKTESAIAWGAPIVQIKRLWLPLLIPFKESKKLVSGFLLLFRMKVKSAF